ncbi:ferric reductase-like transmembrane domain-containing protein [Demequina sp. SYSU T00039]|uniref:Ferric reductase-like transmembrane domain-containing protein n=1 Tax=Demequina lignilytica TaxID=3051663 RepID=A0AAW7M2Y0_9MICO|nr:MULTISPECIES: ferric reductase-like transmembrane domain-containing protein [unclassified Demequina]MDN4477217.1 ferric reductase-like transmembrane domain-containing protein [Demequina sp. SYSU T00039-1]MDN4487390.1 ferric reductase-like transmembrane domain-containing protein [Demequina sp. SYSU T00039]MDN4491143.1 ferric reductase-like transmembrane domain-containing protein [Demequina sp. SYSU T00068]
MTSLSWAVPATGQEEARRKRDERRRRAARRSRWKDSVEAALWLVGVGSLAFMLSSGTVDVTSLSGFLVTMGRITGIVASTMIMGQLILIARMPVVERVVGHDRAARLHGQLGRMGFLVMLAHIVTLVLGYALPTQTGIWDQTWQLIVAYGGPMFLAWAGFAVLTIVVVTSLALVRSRWRYENWHAVHIFSYIAVGLAIPHQFTDGETFMAMDFAWWYWLTLWTVAVGGLIAYRVVRPLVRYFRHRISVAAIDTLADGSTVITLTGRDLLRMRPEAGQFFLFRFLQKDLWGEAHPYSLSRAPLDRWMRITVKPLGDHSARMNELKIGTTVMVEGPLGVFTEKTRTGDHLVLAGSGIGITPILAFLETADIDPGRCTVIARASSIEQAPHLDEVIAIAEQRGARVHVLTGPRGDGWSPAENPVRIAELVPDIADADVYACGPTAWVESLFADAEASGLSQKHLHAEEFSW